MRKLATIRKIDALNPIDGADKIEVATVGGWKVVAQKGLYKEGDLAVYFEIDSWIPHTLAPFLTKPEHYPKVFEGVEGQRLKTIKLRGQISQGLLMPIREVEAFKTFSVGDDDGFDLCPEFDVTELLGILKWEKPMNAQLAGTAKGNFPSRIPKTDQERVQNIKKELAAAADMAFEVTEKMEGSSMTVYLLDGVFGVCSRNLDLKETEGNSFWSTARRLDIETKMRGIGQDNIALQGELIGPGIQENIYGLTETQFRVFDVYDVQAGEYMLPDLRRALVDTIGLDHVPVLVSKFVLDVGDSIEGILKLAEGKSELANVEREGIVFKQVDGGMSFKAISNLYLLGEK